jgi:hypothetical protein
MSGANLAHPRWGSVIAAALVTASFACSEPDAKADVVLSFQSVPMAIATETIQIGAFAPEEGEGGLDEGSICLTLLDAVRKGQKIEQPAAARTSALDTCGVVFDGKGTLDVAPGTYAILVRGFPAGDSSEPVIVGCVVAEVGEDKPTIVVELGLADATQPLPTSTCKDLQARCANQCE